jgi:hypothetical protein
LVFASIVGFEAFLDRTEDRVTLLKSIEFELSNLIDEEYNGFDMLAGAKNLKSLSFDQLYEADQLDP